MKCLSLIQPYATLIAIEAKRIETRSWSTSHRGPVAIHASLRRLPALRALALLSPFREALGDLDFDALPIGAVVAVAQLVDVTSTGCGPHETVQWVESLSYPEFEFGDYSPRRYGFRLAGVAPLAEPVPAKGALGLWTLPPDVEAAVRAQVQA